MSVAIALSMVTAAVAGEIKSGLEKGASPDAFNVKDITGPAKGTSLCYRCRLGNRPVTAVFTRTLSNELASLVKEVDQVVEKNEGQQAGAFVVLLSSDPDGDEARVAEFAKKHGIKNVPLTVFDGEAGPAGYNIAKEAEVTVNLWNKSKVEANHAYAKGGLNKDGIAKIIADAEKMLK
jgi:hypothetical protein